MAIATSFRSRSRATGGDTSGRDGRHRTATVTPSQAVAPRIAELIAPLRSDPASAAVLCDVDGTLAPIVSDPEDAAVPARTQELLRELARRYRLVACVSGRRAVEARKLVRVDELAYAGNHGLELLMPGASEAILEPAVEEGGRAVRQFVLELEPDAPGAAGLRLEDKGPIQALHWRGAADEEAAEERARQIAEERPPRGPRAALGAKGAGDPPHLRDRQGHRCQAAARRRSDRAGAVRRRRPHRPRRLPRRCARWSTRSGCAARSASASAPPRDRRSSPSRLTPSSRAPRSSLEC